MLCSDEWEDVKVVVCDSRETVSVYVGLGSDKATRLPR